MNVRVGQQVYWNDPDHGICSGVFQVQSVKGEIISLTNPEGSEVEALLHELTTPELLHDIAKPDRRRGPRPDIGERVKKNWAERKLAMASHKWWKVYDAMGKYRAACDEPESAAALVTFFGDGATVRANHDRGSILWTEGAEQQPAAENYDYAGETIILRYRELLNNRRNER